MQLLRDIRVLSIFTAFSALVAVPAPAQESQGTGWTYQGMLNMSGGPLDGNADFGFTLWDAEAGGNQIGPEIVATNITVVDGLFTVELDFGMEAFDGRACWLEIGVAYPSDTSALTSLSPRQPMTAAPTALALRGLRTTESEHDDFAPGSWNIVGGYRENSIASGVGAAVIAGGGKVDGPNRVMDSFSTIGGGVNNTADGGSSTISGGWNNSTDGNQATVSGGATNAASADSAAVGGGFWNTASGEAATVGGGFRNNANGDWSVVSGGQQNIANSNDATISGGDSNVASANWATVGGGTTNTASGQSATVAGGNLNVASGDWSAIPGGQQNMAAGSRSFAAGRRAGANHDGAFVWGDSTNEDFASTDNDQFLIRAAGGVGINTNDPLSALDVNGAIRSHNPGGSPTGSDIHLSSPGGNIGITMQRGDGAGEVQRRWDMLIDSDNTFRIWGGATEYLAIDTTGDVGIGTLTPSAKLDVAGNAEISGTLTVGGTASVTGIVFPDGTVQTTATVGSDCAGSVLVKDSGLDFASVTCPAGMTISRIATGVNEDDGESADEGELGRARGFAIVHFHGLEPSFSTTSGSGGAGPWEALGAPSHSASYGGFIAIIAECSCGG